MHFELEKLFRRKLIKDFFAGYSESKWETLLQIILEIGLAYLANNYNITKLSLENLQNILSKKLKINLNLNIKSADLKTPYFQLSENIKLKGFPKEKAFLPNENSNIKNILAAEIPKAKNQLSNNKNYLNKSKEALKIQKAFDAKNIRNPNNSFDYYSNFYNNNNNNDHYQHHNDNSQNYPNFANQYFNMNEFNNLNNANNPQNNFYYNKANSANYDAIISEPNKNELKNKSPLNNLKSVTKTANKQKKQNAVVHNHIADTIRSVSNTRKTQGSKNKIYVRNKSKNNYETTKSNIFPYSNNNNNNYKNNKNKTKKSRSKSKQKIHKNNNYDFNHDLKNYYNFNTEPSDISENYNNFNDNFIGRNINNNNNSFNEFNYSRNQDSNFNEGYLNKNNYNNYNNNNNAYLDKVINEKKIKNNNFYNQNDIQRGRQIEQKFKAQNSVMLNNYTNSRSNSGYARKPSSEWRKGESSLEPARVQNAYQNFNINNSFNNANDMNMNNLDIYNDIQRNPNRLPNNQIFTQNLPPKPQTANQNIYTKYRDHSNSYSQDYEGFPYPQTNSNQNQNLNQINPQIIQTNQFNHNTNLNNLSNFINENLEKNNADLSKTQQYPYVNSNNQISIFDRNQTNKACSNSNLIKQRERYLDKMHQEQEVYYSDLESQKKQQILSEIQQQKSNSKTKMKEYNQEKKAEKMNVSKIESKIKEKVKNDKENFKEKRKEADEYYKSLGFKSYDEWATFNNNKEKDDDKADQYKKYQGPTIVKKNFLISYDKNLQPADVKENLKEIPFNKAKAMKLISDEESKISNLNNFNNNKNLNNNFNIKSDQITKNNYTGNSYENYKDYTGNRVNDTLNNNNNNNNFNNANSSVENASFKNNNNNYNNQNIYNEDYNNNPNFNSEENNAENEKEMLSSFSPSEKTKNFFQKEIGQEKYFENENNNNQNQNDSQILSTKSLRANSIEEPLMKNQA